MSTLPSKTEPCEFSSLITTYPDERCDLHFYEAEVIAMNDIDLDQNVSLRAPNIPTFRKSYENID